MALAQLLQPLADECHNYTTHPLFGTSRNLAPDESGDRGRQT